MRKELYQHAVHALSSVNKSESESTLKAFSFFSLAAVVHLSSTVQFDNNVYPICLLPPAMRFHSGKECFVTGWGQTQFNGTQPDILREAKLKLVPRVICNLANSYNGKVHSRALCAGFQKGGVDACQYDSGGPLACESQGRWYLTGIVSWGHECARPHKYGVYTNMRESTAWVKAKILEHSGMLAFR